MELVLIRHGRTIADDEDIIEGGGYDAPLSGVGLEQADKLAARLQRDGYAFDVLHCSPLARAKQTAEAIARTIDVEATYDPRLSELHLGCSSGRPIGVDPKPEAYYRAHVRFPDGEAYVEQIARVMSYWMEMQHAHADSRVCIVAHGGTLNILIALIYGLPMASPYWQQQRFRFPLGDTAMSRFHIYGPLDVVTYFINDTAHLIPSAISCTKERLSQ